MTNSFGVDIQVSNQLSRGLTPFNAKAGETTSNNLPLQPPAQLIVDELQGDVRMELDGKCGQKKPARLAYIEQAANRRYNSGERSSVYRNFNLISADASMFHSAWSSLLQIVHGAKSQTDGRRGILCPQWSRCKAMSAPLPIGARGESGRLHRSSIDTSSLRPLCRRWTCTAGK